MKALPVIAALMLVVSGASAQDSVFRVQMPSPIYFSGTDSDEGGDGGSPTEPVETLTLGTPAVSPVVASSIWTYVPEASGGVEPYTWNIAIPETAPDLHADEATGVISGTHVRNANIPITVQVTDAHGSTAEQVVTAQFTTSGAFGGSLARIAKVTVGAGTTDQKAKLLDTDTGTFANVARGDYMTIEFDRLTRVGSIDHTHIMVGCAGYQYMYLEMIPFDENGNPLTPIAKQTRPNCGSNSFLDSDLNVYTRKLRIRVLPTTVGSAVRFTKIREIK